MSFNNQTRRPFLLCLLATVFAVLFADSASAQRDLKDIPIPDPELERKSFIVAEGFEVNLYAADPLMAKPIHMNFDSRGRLWIASSEVYPHIKPGQKANDKILVLEDTDGDGRADKTTVFADGLLIPTGVAPGDGGAYVANSTELLHLKDTDGDGKADQKRIVLSGFGTEDTHHILHTLRWGPDGMLYFNQSIYIHSHIETPFGVKRLDAGGIWHFRPETMQLNVFVRGFVNPWGHHFDRWGQSFATDGAFGEGINYIFPGAVFFTAKNATRILHGLNPGSPKHCGLEIVGGRHLPDGWQGNMITNDFRAHRVCRFVVSEDGSGYASRQEVEVIKTKHVAFRPIDVKMGPDGAIYIADWYNPIIQHGEVDFRDSRRDHTHGRIWRVTAKGRPLVKRSKIDGEKIAKLIPLLRSPEDSTRLYAKLELKRHPDAEVAAELHKMLEGLDLKNAASEHLRLEALWAFQTIDFVEPKLLAELLTSKDYHVRAAATRVVYHWRDRLDNTFALLTARVHDKHPRVRLEAVRVLSRIPSAQSAATALAVLDYKMDRFLDFALWQTMQDLQPQWLPAVQAGRPVFGGNVRHLTYALQSVGSPKVAGPLMRLIASGKVPPAREEGILLLLASLGEPAHLAKIFELAVADETPAVRRAMLLKTLVKTARERKIRPSGDLSRIAGLLSSDDETLQQAAARACGFWKLEAARGSLTSLASAPGTQAGLRLAAMEGLAQLGGQRSKNTLTKLSGKGHSFDVRSSAVAALSTLDLAAAAKLAVAVMRDKPKAEQTEGLFTALLRRSGGAKAMVAALSGKKLPADIAKIGLRAIDAAGRPEPGLMAALRDAGAITGGPTKLSPAQLAKLVRDVKTHGNAARGEMIFRRGKAACLKCHAIAGAGGRVGPDLVSIGASAQIDYLIESLLDPSKKIKENFHSLVVATDDGEVITGVKLRQNQRELVLRDTEDREIAIPLDTIEAQRDGGSLMPAGVAGDLTRDELVDLVRFLSELGKVGNFAVGREPVVRRWQTLSQTAEAHRRLNRTSLDMAATDDPALSWAAAYAKVSGDLPVEGLPIQEPHRNLGRFSIVRMQVDVSTAGAIGLKWNSTAGLSLWVDTAPTSIKSTTMLELVVGRHTLTVAIDRGKRSEALRCELVEVAKSPARAQLVGGK